jgi:hypothetical protein
MGGTELKDSVLTYSITKDSSTSNNYFKEIVDLIFYEWEQNINNIHFKNKDDKSKPHKIRHSLYQERKFSLPFRPWLLI